MLANPTEPPCWHSSQLCKAAAADRRRHPFQKCTAAAAGRTSSRNLVPDVARTEHQTRWSSFVSTFRIHYASNTSCRHLNNGTLVVLEPLNGWPPRTIQGFSISNRASPSSPSPYRAWHLSF